MAELRKTLRIGTRKSALAKSQTGWVVNRLRNFHPHLKIEIKDIVTTGDKLLSASFINMLDKGVFVKEIEEQLLAGAIDLAVHSMKDLPTEFPDGLIIGATPERLDPRDVLVTKLKVNLDEMPEGARIGTSSLRRKAQLSHRRPDFDIIPIRGNIDTRLKKAKTDEYDGILLAAAGLTRMGWLAHVQEFLGCSIMIPAVGQGALGIEIRENDDETLKLIDPLNELKTEMAVKAERAFLHGMGGGCQTPMGALCRERDGKVIFHAFCAQEDGSEFQTHTVEGELENALELADQLVSQLKGANGT